MFRQLFRFCLVGVLNTGIDFFIYLFLTRQFSWMSRHYLTAAGIAFIIAAGHGFLWSKYWTFKKGGGFHNLEFFMFYAAAGSALLVNEVILWTVVQLGYFDLIGKFFGAAAAAGVNFLMQRYLVFGLAPVQDKKIS